MGNLTWQTENKLKNLTVPNNLSLLMMCMCICLYMGMLTWVQIPTEA